MRGWKYGLKSSYSISSRSKGYRQLRRKYIEWKRSAKQKLRVPLYPFLAIRYIKEQIAWGHFPTLDRNMFLTDSILERWLYYDIHFTYQAKIYPQYPIGPFWADFALPDYRLVIELDGYQYHKDRKEQDHQRDLYMEKRGWTVMRFTYKDVKNKRVETLKKIDHYIKHWSSSHTG